MMGPGNELAMFGHASGCLGMYADKRFASNKLCIAVGA